LKRTLPRIGGLREAKVRDLNGVTATRAEDLIEQAEKAPADLVEAVKEMDSPLTHEGLAKARRIARDSKASGSSGAQDIGDEVIRQEADANAPLPRQLSVRSRVNVELALPVRERAYQKLEALGLSGIVTPEEGGQMRIIIGVDPTKFDGLTTDPSAVQTMRSRFARASAPEPANCKTAESRARMQRDAVLATDCIVEALKETGDYEYVERDYIFMPQLIRRPKTAAPSTTSVDPNDPLYSLQWSLMDNAKIAGGAGFRDFWSKAKTTGSKSVVVAVVDTGLQMKHPDIAKSPNLAAGFDMVSDPVVGNDGDGRDPDPNDPGDACDPDDVNSQDTFHGTHVAGTIGAGASNNASGVTGAAWNVTVVPVRALGRCGGRLSDINDAIRWAAGTVPARDTLGQEVWNKNPADIINLSIGLFEPCPASMQAAIDDAVKAGAIVVAAAGNDRVDTKYYAPAGCRNVIAVAAGDRRGVLAPYSNFGDNVAILAPGGDMERDDDKDGRPDGILSTRFSRNCYDPVDPAKKLAECYYAFESGTSMAAPHVSAALALIKTKFPSAVPSELKARLLAATTPRTTQQCSGKCAVYPGTSPIPGQDGMCYRPCGGALLNLSNAALK
jgi:serine protease